MSKTGKVNFAWYGTFNIYKHLFNVLICLVTQAAVVTSGMADKLQQPGHFTLFAPTNAAFSKLSPGYLERIMADKDVLAGMLSTWWSHTLMY